MIEDACRQFMQDKLFIYATQLTPDQDNTKAFAKLDKRLLKAIGKMSRNFREGWYSGKWNGKHVRGTNYALRDHLRGSWKSIRNNR